MEPNGFSQGMDEQCGLLIKIIFQVAQRVIVFEQGRSESYFPSNLSLKLLKYVANNGHVSAQSQLGGFLFTMGVGQADKRNGIEYIKQAAKAGECEAQFMLGRTYREDNPLLAKSDRLSAHWLTLAADNGHQAAAKELLELRQSDSMQPVINNPFKVSPIAELEAEPA